MGEDGLQAGEGKERGEMGGVHARESQERGEEGWEWLPAGERKERGCRRR